VNTEEFPGATKDLLWEASVMAQVAGHRNLVSIIGVITRGDPLVLVLQYCEHGSVIDELETQAAAGTPVSYAIKMKMALDVAHGMEHLASLRFIHRDLAARNVLVADGKLGGGLANAIKNQKTGASLVCKVADFGLSRGGDGGIAGGSGDGDESKELYYKSSKGVFPIRWTAPEAMDQLRFTEASDVWSFAVFVVELFQDGVLPYNGKSNSDVMTMVLSGGWHPNPSSDCNDRVYAFLLQCWDHNVAKRPGFNTVVAHFEYFCDTAAAPEIEARQSSYKKLDSANNVYTDFKFAAWFAQHNPKNASAPEPTDSNGDGGDGGGDGDDGYIETVGLVDNDADGDANTEFAATQHGKIGKMSTIVFPAFTANRKSSLLGIVDNAQRT